jgi:hypothetical protein
MIADVRGDWFFWGNHHSRRAARLAEGCAFSLFPSAAAEDCGKDVAPLWLGEGWANRQRGSRMLIQILGRIDIFWRDSDGSIFSQFEERGATHTGCLLATIDEEMGENGPVPSGCGEKPAILHSRPRRWTRHSLRTRLRLAGFSLATLRVRICRYALKAEE